MKTAVDSTIEENWENFMCGMPRVCQMHSTLMFQTNQEACAVSLLFKENIEA